jgi:murein DD-endopeptidase MepM/ murein hydrolase activator NlpD
LNKFFLPLVMTIMLFFVVVPPYQGHALSELQKINKELAKLKREQDAANKRAINAKYQMRKISSDKKQAEKDINFLLAQIEKTGKQLKEIESRIDTASNELVEAGEQLENAEDRVVTRDHLLRSRLRLMYTNGFVSYMDVLLSSTSFSDFLDRYDALKSIVSQDKDILAVNKQDRELIADKKVQIEKQLQEVKELYAKTEAIKQSLLVKEKHKEVLIASLDAKGKELEHISEEQERLVIEFANQVSKLQEKKKKLNYYTGGKLKYPLPELFPITSNFGGRVDPITGRKGAYHQGTDFGAPGGTSILAAETGVVLVAKWWNGYGNTVIIDHGNGLWTLYAHIRSGGIKVSEGETVKRGEKIAEVGSTGRSTGNHLHFEVRLNEKAVDPMKYLR